MRGWVLSADSRAGVEAGHGRAAEERDGVVSACVFRSATGVVRRACCVADHRASLRVGGDVAIVLHRIHALIAQVGPGRDRGVAGVLEVDGGERRAFFGGVELGERAQIGLLDGGGGADFGVLRGGGSVEVACADECSGHEGGCESEFAEVRFHCRL